MKPLLTEGEIVLRASERYKRFRFRLLAVGGLLLLVAVCGFLAMALR